MCLNDDRTKIFTGSHDGFVTYWDAATGVNDRISGTGHGNQINGMKVVGSTLYTCGIDDTLRLVDLNTFAYTNTNDLKLGSQPRGMDVAENRVIVATVKEVSFLLLFKKQILRFIFTTTLSTICVVNIFMHHYLFIFMYISFACIAYVTDKYK